MPRTRSVSLHRLTGDVDARLATIAATSGLLFVLLAVVVALHPAPLFFDRQLTVDIQSVNIRGLDPFNAFVSAFSGFVGVGVGLAVVVATFLLRRAATPFVAFSALYALVYNVVNLIIRRPRPTGLAHTTPDLIGFSFPSGHVGFFVWLGVLAIVLLARDLPRPLHYACWVLVGVLVVASALSRVYVGAHWPSDVVGGLLVGLCWSFLSLSLGRLTAPIYGARGASGSARR